ncbi:hypothetical protein H9P43_009298 [Blastocladiella emersonii ATCC 22665]|nr:hypothetical protein H9P43_009298 [Blastocladiella emersonii ATCC 22665]
MNLSPPRRTSPRATSAAAALLALAIVAAALVTRVAAVYSGTRYAWSLAVRGQPASSSVGLYPVLEPGNNYTLVVSITKSASPCLTCARDLHAVGGYPVVSFADTLLAAQLDVTDAVAVRSTYSPTAGTWQIPVTAASGVVGTAHLYVQASVFVPPSLAREPEFATVPQSFVLGVTRLFSVGSDGMPKTGLGTIAPVPAGLAAPFALSKSPTVAVLNSRLVVSANEWRTSAMVTPAWSAGFRAANPVVCSGATDTTVLDAKAVAGTLLLATTRGLVAYTGGSNLTAILPQCITTVVAAQSRDPVLAKCTNAAALSSSRIWRVDVATLAVAELVSADNQTLAQFLGVAATSLTLVGADFSSEDCRNLAVLYTRGGVYHVATMTDGAWIVRFKFPAAVPFYSPASATPQLFNGSTAIQYPTAYTVTTTGSRDLSLSRITYSELPTGELFVYGSALFYSPDDGGSQYLMEVFPSPVSIVALDSSDSAYSYLYMTSDNIIYGGLTPFPQTMALTQAASSTVAVGFDSLDAPYALRYDAASGALVRTDLRWGALWDPAVMQAAAETATTGVPATCPYESLRVQGSLSPTFTRSAVVVPQSSGADQAALSRVSIALPAAIYLDYHQSYTFTVDLSPAKGTSLAALELAVKESNSALLHVDIVRTEVAGEHRVTYTVTVTDRGTYPLQQVPGDAPGSATLAVHVLGGEPCPISAIGPLVVYIGCPPGLALEVDAPAAGSQQCVNADPGVPCFHMDADYKPTYTLVDTVAGTRTPFAQPVTLQLVAAGPAPRALTAIPHDAIATTNLLTWAPNTDGDPVQLPDSRYVYPGNAVNVSWVCLGGSPCSGVVPTFPNPAEYYFVVETSTAGVAAGISYCLLSTRHPVRLYGLAVDLATSLIATGITLAVTVALVLAAAAWQRHKHVRDMFRVAPAAAAVVKPPMATAGQQPVRSAMRPGTATVMMGSALAGAGAAGSRPGSGRSRHSVDSQMAPLMGGVGADVGEEGVSTATAGAGATGVGGVHPIMRTRPAIPEEDTPSI